MPRTDRTINDVVREIMGCFPEAEEFLSHGSPTFRVRNKVFATYTINHHGDGRVALILMAPRGAQAAFTKMQPSAYFVPPYVGSRGWLGVELDKGLDWEAVFDHVKDAYALAAPSDLVAAVRVTSRIQPPTRQFRPEEIDPFQGRLAKAILEKLAEMAADLPETARGSQFGAPVWKAGKRVFMNAHHYTGRFKLSFWVGAKRQAELVKDDRYSVSRYIGHNGWIDLDVEPRPDWNEIRQLMLESYRHFALKRMLADLAKVTL